MNQVGAVLGAANRLVLSQGCRGDLPPFLGANQPNRRNILRLRGAVSRSTDRSSAQSNSAATHSKKVVCANRMPVSKHLRHRTPRY
jgi:hypothetical protein